MGVMTRLLFTLIAFVVLASCASQYQQIPSDNYGARVKSLVLHYTAINYADSLKALADEGGLSSHYLVPESNDPSYPYQQLRIKQLVPEQMRAWHAGQSYWQGRTNLNDTSIGIEIVNVPTCRYPEHPFTTEYGASLDCDFPAFDPKQIALVISLSQDILARHPDIHPTAVVAHSDIAPQRKNDPGPKFPWYQLYQAGVGAWYDPAKQAHYLTMFEERTPSVGWLQEALYRYGYDTNRSGIFDQHTRNVIRAFQYHFTPQHTTGLPNAIVAATVLALLDKYFPENVEPLLNMWSATSEQNTKRLSNYQVDEIFPTTNPASRELVNNRHAFIMQKGQGNIRITSNRDVSADIFINEQALNLPDIFTAEREYAYSLQRRTHDGINILRVDNVQPSDGQIRIQIDYPKLTSRATQSDFTAVNNLIQEEVERGFPGAVLLIAQNGNILHHKAYGTANKKQNIPIQTNTLFDLASNTKIYATVFAIMHLVETGQLNLDATVQSYLPEYTGAGREFRKIIDLLQHSSGYAPSIPFYAEEKLAKLDLPGLFSQHPERTDALLTEKVEFVASAGEQATYSDLNFMVLGMLVERVTQMPLDVYVETQLYQPLGLNSLVFNPLSKGFQPEQCAATEFMGNTRGERIYFENVRTDILQCEVHDEKAFYSKAGVAGHAGLFGTALDVATLAQLVLNQGGYGNQRLFSPTTLAQFTAPSLLDPSFGLGWRRNAPGMAWMFGPYASKQAFGHTGWTGTVSIIDPQHDLVIVLLTNKRHAAIQGDKTDFDFVTSEFETGRYGSVISLIYEAILTTPQQ